MSKQNCFKTKGNCFSRRGLYGQDKRWIESKGLEWYKKNHAERYEFIKDMLKDKTYLM